MWWFQNFSWSPDFECQIIIIFLCWLVDLSRSVMLISKALIVETKLCLVVAHWMPLVSVLFRHAVMPLQCWSYCGYRLTTPQKCWSCGMYGNVVGRRCWPTAVLLEVFMVFGACPSHKILRCLDFCSKQSSPHFSSRQWFRSASCTAAAGCLLQSNPPGLH